MRKKGVSKSTKSASSLYTKEPKPTSLRFWQTDVYAKFIFYCVVTLLVVFFLMGTGCNKLVKIQDDSDMNMDRSQINRGAPKTVHSLDEMLIPKTFDWNTARRIRISIQVRDGFGKLASDVKVKVHYRSQSTNALHQVASGFSDESGGVDTTFNIPVYVKTVFIKTNNSGERLFEVPVNSYMFDYTLRL